MIPPSEREFSVPDYHIPPHPQPGIFETTVVEGPNGPITHHDIEALMATHPATVEELDQRARAAMKERGWTTNSHGLPVPPKKKRPARKRR